MGCVALGVGELGAGVGLRRGGRAERDQAARYYEDDQNEPQVPHCPDSSTQDGEQHGVNAAEASPLAETNGSLKSRTKGDNPFSESSLIPGSWWRLSQRRDTRAAQCLAALAIGKAAASGWMSPTVRKGS
jgi:hypothetical protein